MAVSSEVRSAGPFVGDGTTRTFTFSFKIFDKSQVKVLTSTDGGDSETTVDDALYSVTLNDDQDVTPGGSVTMTTAPAVGVRLSILSAVPYVQTMVLTNRGGFYPDLINDAVDRAVILSQQNREMLERTVRVPSTSDQTPEELGSELFAARNAAQASASQAAASESNAAGYAAAAQAAKTAAEDALASVEEGVEDQLSAIAAAGATQVVLVTSAGTSQVDLVVAQGNTEIQELQAATPAEIAKVAAEGADQVDEVNAAGAQRLAEINAAGGAQVEESTAQAALAKGYAEIAQASMTAAQAAENNADRSQKAAAVSEQNAKSSENSAKQSEQNAAGSAAEALQTLADVKAEGDTQIGRVDDATDGFIADAKAEIQAESTKQQGIVTATGTAQVERVVAACDEQIQEATAQAEAAAQSAAGALASQNAAKTSETAAAGSATAAAGSATTAGQKADAASASASAASASQSAAKTSETNAAASATAANNSKTAAATSEANALTYRNEAEGFKDQCAQFVDDLGDPLSKTEASETYLSKADAASTYLVKTDPAASVAWANVTGKPGTFTPSSHTHTIANVTGLQSALDALLSKTDAAGTYLTQADAAQTYLGIHAKADSAATADAVSWDNVTGKPQTFTATAHTHAQSDVTGLATTLATFLTTTNASTTYLSKTDAQAQYLGKTAKAASAASADAVAWSGVTGKPTTVTGYGMTFATTADARAGTDTTKPMNAARVKEAVQALAPAPDLSSYATKSELEAAVQAAILASVPTGTILPFAGTVVPDGFLLCNGAAVSRTTYAKLFAAIGTKWGSGDGSTTFNLPDSDGRVFQGTTDVSKVGTYLEAGLPNITGDAGIMCGASDSNASGAFTRNNWGSTGSVSGSWFGRTYLGFLASRSSGIFGASSTVQPLSIQQLAIIKI